MHWPIGFRLWPWRTRLGPLCPEERAARLIELEECQDWLARRAADAPRQLPALASAGRGRAGLGLGRLPAGRPTHSIVPQREASTRQRPWHRALIAERAALFHLEHGLEHSGRKLLVKARRLSIGPGARRRKCGHSNTPIPFSAGSTARAKRTTHEAAVASHLMQSTCSQFFRLLRL